MYAASQALILLIDVSYTAACELIDSLSVPQMIHDMYTALPGSIVVGLTFFGVSQVLNIIMVAAVTRFCMHFVPFIGR